MRHGECCDSPNEFACIAKADKQQAAYKNLQVPLGKSMWGNKFKPEELKIAKTWAGVATKSLTD